MHAYIKRYVLFAAFTKKAEGRSLPRYKKIIINQTKKKKKTFFWVGEKALFQNSH